MLISEFSQVEKIIPYPRTIICNDYEQMNVLGRILNAGGNVEDQEYYGFTASFFKIPPIFIYERIKNKLMKKEITPMLNNYEQKLNYLQCEYIYKIEKKKEDNFTSEEDSDEQAREDKKKTKGENITYNGNIPEHDRKNR